MRFGKGDELLGLVRVHRQRFFADDVLAGLERFFGLLEVEAVGRGDVDHRHLVVSENILKSRVAHA